MNTTTSLIVLGAIIIIGIGAYFVFGNDQGSVYEASPTATTTGDVLGSEINVGPGMPAEPAAVAARVDLAERLNVAENSIVIMKVAEATWNDGCLGLGGAAESCLAALVPGYTVELRTQGETYLYRTDKTGAAVRYEGVAVAK